MDVRLFFDALGRLCREQSNDRDEHGVHDCRECPALRICDTAPASIPGEILDSIIQTLVDRGELEHPQHTNTEAPTHSRHHSAVAIPGQSE